MKSAFESKAAGRVSAWVLVKGGEQAGRLLAVWGDTGVCTVTLAVYGAPEVRTKRRGGGGYDKVGSALCSMFYKENRAAADLFDAGQVEDGFGVLGFGCWRAV